MWNPLRPALAAAALALAGCALMGGSQLPGGARVRFDLITQDQIVTSGLSDLYEVIRKQRPYWIRKAGDDTSENPGIVHVYLNGAPYGRLEQLRSISLGDVAYVRWIEGIEAASRWGLDHERGVIYVSTEPLAR